MALHLQLRNVANVSLGDRAMFAYCTALALSSWLGCGGQTKPANDVVVAQSTKAAPPPSSATNEAKPKAPAKAVPLATKQVARDEVPSPPTTPKTRPAALEALAARGAADEEAHRLDPLRFHPPEVNREQLAARGIRVVESKHLTLYTDLPASVAVDELPRVFDAAIPLWSNYFELPPDSLNKWRVTAVIARDQETFANTPLWPNDLPQFPHGYMRQGQLWCFEQPSDYYRRHLLLHEGTHALMEAYFGSLGPPWFAEGVAELLGTHRWSEGKLELGVMPAAREEVPLWGRIKSVRDDIAAGDALNLIGVMKLGPLAHRETKSYAWSWAAAVFFDHDPQWRTAFRGLRNVVADTSFTFSERLFAHTMHPQHTLEQWQWFISNLDYGYDVEREAILRREAAPWMGPRQVVTLSAERGWQSSGLQVTKGMRFDIAASGQFQIAKRDRPWLSEANGITLRYYRDHRWGQLLAAVTDEGESGDMSALLTPYPLGNKATLTCDRDGVIYFRVNEFPNGWRDNAGEITITLVESR